MNCKDIYEEISKHHPLLPEQQREEAEKYKRRSLLFAVVTIVSVVVGVPLWVALVELDVVLVSGEIRWAVTAGLVSIGAAAAVPGVWAENVHQQVLSEIEPVNTEQLAVAVELARHDPRYAVLLLRWTAVTGELRKKEFRMLKPAFSGSGGYMSRRSSTGCSIHSRLPVDSTVT